MASSRSSGTPTAGPYTKEQLDAIEKLKHESYYDGMAKSEHVNQVLWPDGSLTTGTDEIVSAAKAAVTQALSLGTEPEHLSAATDASRKVKEVEDHIAQNRFLLVVDGAGVPVVYFPCAVDGNPDMGRTHAEARKAGLLGKDLKEVESETRTQARAAGLFKDEEVETATPSTGGAK